MNSDYPSDDGCRSIAVDFFNHYGFDLNRMEFVGVIQNRVYDEKESTEYLVSKEVIYKYIDANEMKATGKITITVGNSGIIWCIEDDTLWHAPFKEAPIISSERAIRQAINPAKADSNLIRAQVVSCVLDYAPEIYKKQCRPVWRFAVIATYKRYIYGELKTEDKTLYITIDAIRR
jgi:hypothetical protein